MPMTDLLRQEIAALATTIVVKVGTRVLTREDGQLDEQRIQRSPIKSTTCSQPAGRWCWSAPGPWGPAWDGWG